MSETGNSKNPPGNSYEVGYGKPPKHGQFKPGTSGNPKGGKKVVKTIQQLVDEELSRTTSVKLGGDVVKMTKMQALAKRIVADALAGDQHCIRLALSLQAQALAGDGMGAEAPLTESEIEQLLSLARLPDEVVYG